ncbi:MAG: type IV pili methyl-accepting chemotaxis transducer N-terminal domain-containing protein [Proteobacteria bacterium]|nr:type IV pili methyl-accepting chemotaxis transducer N-terminal domain-containing protein [Pseudomonadota bacterium]
MALKLPFLSKASKGAPAEDDIYADEDASSAGISEYHTLDGAVVPTKIAVASGGVVAPKPSAAPAPTAAPAPAPVRAGIEETGKSSRNPDSTFIGDVLERSGDFRLPFIGEMPLAEQVRLLFLLLAGALFLAIVFVFANSRSSAISATQTQIAAEMLMHSQRIGKAAPNAIQGNAEAFKQLQDSRNALQGDWNILYDGGTYQNRKIGAPDAAMKRVLEDTQRVWEKSEISASTILKLQTELTGFGATLKKINSLSPDMLELSDQIASLKVNGGAAPKEIAAAAQLSMLTQRMGRSANAFLTTQGMSPETAFSLGKDSNTFGDIIDGFLNGSEAMRLSATRDQDTRDKLTELNRVFTEYKKAIASIQGNLQSFISAKQAEQTLFSENESLKQTLDTLLQAYRREQDALSFGFWMMVVFGLLALLAAAGVGMVVVQDSRNRTKEAELRSQEAEAQRLHAQLQEEEAKAANDQNQAAILRLMNELQEVADGDLTVQATVSEDITGAIADSVNYTVEELRVLVGRVTNTAEKVTTASTQAQNISTELLAASQKQSRDIQETGQAVLEMASQITDVSKSANESAEVARQSVTAAEEGARAVENAIKGMHEIRDQIQETSKRIKRLGESSQEIGEITELISDITEQTNVLALNAAIQAASAGEAGRGFSVVAEEVQRLAERSGEATKQIGALVRTIQTDTHDAVAAMEKSTQGVVEGAKLSDAAGTALLDIRRVSNQLAELIQGISAATEQQATSANGVAQSIQGILTVTEHTQVGTQQTAESIRELTRLAEELKNSVSRFRTSA